MTTLKEQTQALLDWNKHFEPSFESQDFWARRRKELEGNLSFYESDRPVVVLKVEGTTEFPSYFRSNYELYEHLEDTEFAEDGVGYTVQYVKMTGREFGQLEAIAR